MPLRDQLIAVQRRVLAAIKRDIRASLGRQPAELRRYYAAYKRRFRQPFTVATREELLRACAAADIIYVGDYHTLAAAQQVALNLLRALWERGRRRWTLALEMLQIADNTAAEHFLAGRMSQEAFLNQIEYDQAWGFPWPNFRILFDFARQHGIRVIGINCPPAEREAGLHGRDICASMAIAQETHRNPGTKILVVDGDMHITPTHLPAKVGAMLHDLETRRRSLIVYQNSETVHWRLVDEGREREVSIVRLSPREFCLQSVHPIVKYQSYLNWIEFEEELAPVLPDALDEDDGDEPDLTDQVLRLVNSICGALGIRRDFSDLTVYTVEDLQYLEDLSQYRVYTQEEIGLVAIQILKGESHALPDGNVIYLANLTVTHAAEEAAHCVNHALSGPMPKVASPLDDFYHRTMREVLGFFGSKIINPSRLAYLDEDFADVERELRGKRVDVQRRDFRKIARLVLEHLAAERAVLAGEREPPRRLSAAHFKQFSVFLGVVHALGYRLGTRLFHAFEQEIISRAEMRDLFSLSFREPGSAQRCYFDLLRRTAEVKVPYERRRERF